MKTASLPDCRFQRRRTDSTRRGRRRFGRRPRKFRAPSVTASSDPRPYRGCGSSAPVAGAGSVALQIERIAGGIELYFPPLRDAAAALALGAFGVLCTALPLVAVDALVPAGVPLPYGLMVLALIGGIVAPFMLCGIAFVGLAVYMVANSLRVSVSASRITASRRAFGLPLSRHELACSEVREIEAEIPSRFQNAFGAGTSYRLVARARAGRARDVVVAESLSGEAVMQNVRREIAAACKLVEAAAEAVPAAVSDNTAAGGELSGRPPAG
jgi:hypothetical protein